MEERIFFNNHENEKIAGSIHLPVSPSRLGIVLGHCFTCSRHTRILRDLCDRLTELGIMALRFDFSGNGQSEGKFVEASYSKHTREMMTAVDYLKGRGADWIGLVGHSMGGALSILTAAEHPAVRAAVTIGSRYTDLNAGSLLNEETKRDLAETGRMCFVSRGRELELTEAFFTDAAGYDFQGIVSRLTVPLLIVHGDRDEIIPVGEARLGGKIRENGTDLAIIEGADHMLSDASHRKKAAQLIIDWLQDKINAWDAG